MQHPGRAEGGRRAAPVQHGAFELPAGGDQRGSHRGMHFTGQLVEGGARIVRIAGQDGPLRKIGGRGAIQARASTALVERLPISAKATALRDRPSVTAPGP